MRVAAGSERSGTNQVTGAEGGGTGGEAGALQVSGPSAIHLSGTGDQLAGYKHRNAPSLDGPGQRCRYSETLFLILLQARHLRRRMTCVDSSNTS
jgi:hypothetical protein